MKEKQLLEAFGQVDSRYIEEAALAQHLKKAAWSKWGSIAACLVLLCAVAVHFFTAAPGEGEIASHGVADIAPMVYVNDTLYIQSSDQKGYPEQKDEFIYLGKIESMVSEEGAPKENFQANDRIVGCEVYQYGENIVVHINGAYWLYVKYS